VTDIRHLPLNFRKLIRHNTFALHFSVTWHSLDHFRSHVFDIAFAVALLFQIVCIHSRPF
jgi:hypothetical protein